MVVSQFKISNKVKNEEMLIFEQKYINAFQVSSIFKCCGTRKEKKRGNLRNLERFFFQIKINIIKVHQKVKIQRKNFKFFNVIKDGTIIFLLLVLFILEPKKQKKKSKNTIK